jgi:hypothetical protein
MWAFNVCACTCWKITFATSFTLLSPSVFHKLILLPNDMGSNGLAMPIVYWILNLVVFRFQGLLLELVSVINCAKVLLPLKLIHRGFCQPRPLLSLYDHKKTPAFHQVLSLSCLPTDRLTPQDSLRDARPWILRFREVCSWWMLYEWRRKWPRYFL